MLEITVQKKDAGQRLDKFIGRVLKKAPLSFIYKSLRGKDIRLNAAKAAGKEILKENDVVLFRFPDVQIADLMGTEKSPAGSPKKIRLEDFGSIVYEDEEMILVSKKAGVLSQRAEAGEVSLNEALLSYCGGAGAMYTPSVCNRIDRNTTGLVAFAKTYAAARMLSDAFHNRDCRKFYLAGVLGDVRGKFHEKAHLEKTSGANRVVVGEEGTEIETAWEDVAHATFSGKKVTLLKVELITGKTHQIRAHLSRKGYPVIGDPKYGGTMPGIRHQILHSWQLILPDGRSFRAPVPGQILRLFKDFDEVGVISGSDDAGKLQKT